MRALKPEEMELAAGGDGTTITVTGTRTETPPSYYEWWKLSGGEGSGGAGAGFGDGGEDTTTTNEYPPCVEASPDGISPSDALAAAQDAANDIAALNDENIEYGAFIYELNGQVFHTRVFTDGSVKNIGWDTSCLPDGAHVIGMIHNHPDISGIDDGVPSSVDWNAYDDLQSWGGARGITVDPNMLMFMYTNEDDQTRVYDNTDKTQTTASCAI
jgi:hypothetical protein